MLPPLPRKVLSGAIALLLLAGCQQQKRPFEGRIHYQPRLTGEGSEQLEPLLKAQDISFSLYHKGNQVRIERATEILLVSYDSDSFHVLLPERQGYHTFALRLLDDTTAAAPTVESVEGEKEVLGHRCKEKKVTTQTPRGTYSTTFYEAQDLLAPEGAAKFYPILPRGVGVRGIPLLIESSIAPDIPVRLIYEADDIQAIPLSDSLFQIPQNYQRLSFPGL